MSGYASEYAKVYDSIFNESDAGLQEAKMLGNRWKDHRVILELGIGTGRISRHFVREGRTVVGVDSSPHMLEVCSNKIGDNENLTLIEADMTMLPLDLSADAALIALGSLSCVFESERRREVFKQLADRLTCGAELIIEIYNKSYVESIHSHCGKAFSTDSNHLDGLAKLTTTYTLESGGERWKLDHCWEENKLQSSFVEEVALLEWPEIAREALPYWEFLDVYGSWGLDPLEPHSPFAVLIFRSLKTDRG